MKEKSKQDVEMFVKGVKELLNLREKRQSIRRGIRCARRMPTRIEKLNKKLELAKAAEAQNPSDANKAEVDRLEESLTMHKAIDFSIMEDKSVALRAQCKEREEALQRTLTILIATGKISKKNANEVLPLVRRAGLVITPRKKGVK
jgi:hypothetical protein